MWEAIARCGGGGCREGQNKERINTQLSMRQKVVTLVRECFVPFYKKACALCRNSSRVTPAPGNNVLTRNASLTIVGCRVSRIEPEII